MPPKDILSNHRARRIAVVVALGGGLALGVAGLAQAAEAPAPSGSAAPSTAPGRGEPREHKPHLNGTVTAITDTKITIKDRDGFTRQINITAKPAGVAVGTRIHAEGAVNKDGVSLDATTVGVAPARDGRPGGGPGHRGGPGGPGMPGGPKGGAPAPSAPAPSASK